MPINQSSIDWDPEEPAANDVTWALGRLPTCTYAHRSFVLNLPSSRDHGEHARYVVKVFDEPTGEGDENWQLEEKVVSTTRGGRVQFKVQIAREAGQVRQLEIHRVPVGTEATKLTSLLKLDREGSAALIDLVRGLDHIPVDGGRTVRVDDSVLQELFSSPDQVRTVLAQFRTAVRSDASAKDVIALAHRREVVATMRSWLEDETAFDAAAADYSGRSEAVWQGLLEDNPWILGLGLSGQLLTSWDEARLEQVVAGFSVRGAGKRVDALMRTQGVIRGMVLAEIKHHKTSLLGEEYRKDCWSPSRELAGGVTQAQQSAYNAVQHLSEFLPDTDDGGGRLPEGTFLVRPRVFLIAGHLDQLRGSGGGVNHAKYRSFELYRRNLYEPEIITFDELLARAEWNVTLADKEARAQDAEEERDDHENS